MSEFTTNPFRNIASKYEIIVSDNETIQQVIDKIPVMQGSLASGITNPYIINVPPGHEKEFYSLVRNASDIASDKRNIKVIFENNPEGKFSIVNFSDCDEVGIPNEIGKWGIAIGADSLVVENVPSSDQKRIKYTSSGSSGIVYIYLYLTDGTTYTDLSEFQGALISIKWPPALLNFAQFRFTDVNNNQMNYQIGVFGSRFQFKEVSHEGTFYVPFVPRNTSYTDFDTKNIKHFQLVLNANAFTDDVYINDLRLVRTTPDKKIIIRFDDSLDEHYTHAIEELEKKGWKGSFQTIAGSVDSDVSTVFNTVQAKEMGRRGHLITNHGIDDIYYENKNYNESFYGYHATNNWLLMHGLSHGFGIAICAGLSKNIYIDKIVENSGGIIVLEGSLPVMRIGGGTPVSTAELEVLEGFVGGGVFDFGIHTFSTSAELKTILDYIEVHFSEVILWDEVIQKSGQEWPGIAFSPQRRCMDCGYQETLSVDRELRAWEGNTFFFDPGGAARDIILNGKNTTFPSGHKITIVNTADAAETLTFDPLFDSSGIADNTSNLLTDISNTWIVGQLVGRTINNTTDGSSGIITGNGASTVTTFLSGGTNNTWVANDNYTITPVGSNQDITQGNSQEFVYDGEGWH